MTRKQVRRVGIIYRSTLWRSDSAWKSYLGDYLKQHRVTVFIYAPGYSRQACAVDVPAAGDWLWDNLHVKASTPRRV